MTANATQQLQAKIESLEAQNAALSAMLDNGSKTDFQIFKANEELQREILRLKQEIDDLNEQNVDLALQVGDLEVCKAEAEQYRAIKDQYAQATKERSVLQAQVTELSERLDAANKQVSKLQEDKVSLLEKLENIQGNLTENARALSVTQMALTKAKEDAAQYESSLNLFKKQFLDKTEVIKSSLELPALKDEPSDTIAELEAILLKTIGRAGKVIFDRKAKELIGADTKSADAKSICKLAISLRSPSLKLCRSQEASDTLTKELDAFVFKLGSPEGAKVAGSSLPQAPNPEPNYSGSKEKKAEENQPSSDRPEKKQEAFANTAAVSHVSKSESKLQQTKNSSHAITSKPSQNAVAKAEPLKDSPVKADSQPTKEVENVKPQEPEDKIDNTIKPSASESKPAKSDAPPEVTSLADLLDDISVTAASLAEDEPNELLVVNPKLASLYSSIDKETELKDTYIPNAHLDSELVSVAKNLIDEVLQGPIKTKDDKQAHLAACLWQPAHLPVEIVSGDTAMNFDKIKVRECLDLDLDLVVTWMNYIVLSRSVTEFKSTEDRKSQFTNVAEAGPELQSTAELAKHLASNIFCNDSLFLKFFDGTYLVEGDLEPTPSLFINRKVHSLPLSEQAFLIGCKVFALLRRYPEIKNVVSTITGKVELPDLGAILLKRTVSSVIEKGILLPPDLLGETSSLWGSETIEEINQLLTRCYEASQFPQFKYCQEIITNPYPLRQNMNMEVDLFGLKLSNIWSASLSIVRMIAGYENAEKCRFGGLKEVMFSNSPWAPYLRQRIKSMWIGYLES